MWKLVVVLTVNLLQGALTDVYVMKDVTLGFGQALEQCREESQLTEEKMEEFFHFWNDDFKFEHRELGCAIQCMSRHFNLLTDSSRMHHENTDKFIKSFPNGEILSQKMIDMIHTCEKTFDSEPDHCWRILRVAECFKDACNKSGLAPSMELILAEFIMESEADK
ncbi:general odorant-binding protein 1 precursor [Bombyx mori]|uniref:General odorant-binding protein 1 n=1 Tax=Bombyx mori TaxID=7091 RepID=OBP1_BOMMO|nr:general odorant-binding protein 1 precursor [Bombyx mori]P34171.2 RecName: Full=General odorant-binding protein 1; Short=GOBP1; Flags: Precursor [Bombyx mori]CAA64444.1 General odorant binding protein 1 [Bombyx mori]